MSNDNSIIKFIDKPKRKIKKKEEELSNTVMLIDSSYTNFYRFYATQTWYSKAYEEEMKEIRKIDNYNWYENDIFLEKYNKLYFSGFDKIRKMYKVSTENMLFAFDCPRSEIWRNDFFQTYKSNRDDEKNKRMNIGEIFRHTYSVIYPNLENVHNVKTIKSNRAEADDIIAVIKKNLREKYSDLKIVIVTNDYDYNSFSDNGNAFNCNDSAIESRHPIPSLITDIIELIDWKSL